ncbi:N-6 DNA methylase [Pseudomonas syringae pv. viburni]|uniref:N-6 DNA methylase n=2 Tax=Pseudomonas TaxID=286 RepID=A0A0Q0K8S2_9PSED|nr:N-6 DNA methylase [Pseudomonas syringae pv. viburni]
MVPRSEIEEKRYDLSLSSYKKDVFEDVRYDAPDVILNRLLRAEVGDAKDDDLASVQGGIVRELLDLRGMLG